MIAGWCDVCLTIISIFSACPKIPIHVLGNGRIKWWNLGRCTSDVFFFSSFCDLVREEWYWLQRMDALC